MFTPYAVQTFSPSIYEMKGISRKTVEEHLKLYTGYVNKYNEINQALSKLSDDDYAKANQSYSLIRELKVELTFAYGGIVNHELYFGHLGGSGGAPSGKLLMHIEKDFGSFDRYMQDMKATGIAARGWVWTAWNQAEKRLFNYLGDAQNTFPVWGATPILAMDTYEHAYFIDFGSARAPYIDAFFENVNWTNIEESFETLA
ncbi:MAG TPA: superoxide dismutase [Candidatus Woesebacteria bacterium]|nr:superoxide dismutase [Candidatus Woesebacteria bacterium]HNS95068.1 superoxide dismutase [Candidatus Woesebacteria bacterium]